jgi:hypothetical protein
MEFITSILNELHDFTNMYIIVKTDDAYYTYQFRFNPT